MTYVTRDKRSVQTRVGIPRRQHCGDDDGHVNPARCVSAIRRPTCGFRGTFGTSKYKHISKSDAWKTRPTDKIIGPFVWWPFESRPDPNPVALRGRETFCRRSTSTGCVKLHVVYSRDIYIIKTSRNTTTLCSATPPQSRSIAVTTIISCYHRGGRIVR